MLMITMREWFGPSKAGFNGPLDLQQKVEIRLRGFVTEYPLADALRKIRRYQEAFNKRYAAGSAIEFELLSVTTIDHLPEDVVEISGAVHVEKLKQSVGEWD